MQENAKNPLTTNSLFMDTQPCRFLHRTDPNTQFIDPQNPHQYHATQMPDQLTTIIDAFPGKRVLLVGDLILDRYIYGDAERISPEAPVPVLRAIETQERVGGSANVAACLRALNIDVLCCGAIPNDPAGRRLRHLLDDTGIDVSGSVAPTDRSTTTKTRFVGLAQHRHRQQLLRLDEESTNPLPTDTANQLIRNVTDRIKNVDVVCIEDYAKGIITPELVDAIITAAGKANIPVIVDPAKVHDFALYSGVSAMTPNRTELEHAANQRFTTPESVIAAGPALRNKWQLDCLVVTLDRDGAVVIEKDQDAVHLPTRPRSVYDNTGAGDAVLACLAAAIASGASWPDAVRLANIAGGLEVEKFGCVPITADQMLADLRIEHRQKNGKLRTLDELIPEITLRKDRGETIVFTNGVFDILHPGHIHYLTQARQLGSFLIVAINTDESVRRLDKDTDRPINNETFRAAMLGALECVDYVTIFNEDTPLELIRKIRPDILVKGGDYTPETVVGADVVRKSGGKIKILPFLEGYSTTTILKKIRDTQRPR